MIDEHKVSFGWPHSEPTEVIVCGSFNDWARTCHLTKGPAGFTGFIYVPWGSKITYKYIVDDIWSINPEEPTEADQDGNINNMYIAPSQPESKPNGSGQPAPAEAPDNTAGNLSHMVAHLPDTVIAREGTSSALDYAASGLGAAVNNIIGIDPVNSEQIAIPTPLQSAVATGTELDRAGSSMSDGVPLFSIPAEVSSSQHHVTQNPVASEDPKAVLTTELPEKVASDISVPVVPANAAESHTVSTPVAELVVAPTEDRTSSTSTAIKVNEDVLSAVEDKTNKIGETLVTVEEPHITVEETPAAESVLAEKENTSKIVDVPIAAAGDEASLVTSDYSASRPEEPSREVSHALKTPEAITPASDLDPSLVLASEGIPTGTATSTTLEEKVMPQDIPIVPIAPLQEELEKPEQTEPAPAAYEVKPAPVSKPGHSSETYYVTGGPETAGTIPEPAVEPQARKESKESVPAVPSPAWPVLTPNAPQKAVENEAEPSVESRSMKQEKQVLQTEAKAETTQGEPTLVTTQVYTPTSEILPAPVPTTGATETVTTSASTVKAAPTEMAGSATEAVPTESRPTAEVRSADNLSAYPVEVAQSATTPRIQNTSVELGPTSPTSVSEAAPEPAPKTEAAPIVRSESQSVPTQDASEPAVPSNGHTEEATVLGSAKKAFPSTVSPIPSPSTSGKALPGRKRKSSIFAKIKHFFESDKGKSKNK